MADSYVCSGATMKCTMGTCTARLTVLPIRTVFLTGQPMANISDHLTMVNLAPFGRCRSLGFPATAAATAAHHGHLTPMPCMHNTPFPWMNGKNDYIVKGDPALLKSSTCQCVWGGTISLVFDGQIPQGPADMSKVSKDEFHSKQTNKNKTNVNTTSQTTGTSYDIVTLDNAFKAETLTLMKMAKDSGNEIQNLAESVAKNNQAVCTPVNYKSEKSIISKAFLRGDNKKGYNDYKEVFFIKDAVRTTIVTPQEYIDNVVAELERNPNHIKTIRHIPEEHQGYSGYLINVKSSNGLIAEIQVNTPEMIYAKEKPEIAKGIIGEDVWNGIHKKTGLEGGRGHTLYEEFRVMKLDDPKRIEIEKESFEYYSHFS